jgi:archaemetzincin
LCLLRTLKTAAHETGHQFGLPHCIAYACCMNGSNHRAEVDRKPLEFCPECQAKLWWTCRIDPRERLRRLVEFADDFGLTAEAKFWRELSNALIRQ